MGDNNSGTDRPVKQDGLQDGTGDRDSSGKFIPGNKANPEGKGGFGDHPELINKEGRPLKDMAMTELLESIGEELTPDGLKTFKELTARRTWLDAMNGDANARRELFNRLMGLPRATVVVDGKIDMKIPELIERLDKIINLKDEPDKNTGNQGNG